MGCFGELAALDCVINESVFGHGALKGPVLIKKKSGKRQRLGSESGRLMN